MHAMGGACAAHAGGERRVRRLRRGQQKPGDGGPDPDKPIVHDADRLIAVHALAARLVRAGRDAVERGPIVFRGVGGRRAEENFGF